MKKTSQVFLAVIMSVVFLTFGYVVFAQRPSFEIANEAPPSVSSLSVSPQAIQNTPITIAVNASDVSGVASVLAYIMNGSTEVAVVTLYDDGSHSDNGASDGRYGNQWNVGDNPETTYRLEIQANDRLGYATNRSDVTANFNIGGQGVSIVSPQNGDYLNGASVDVQISAGGNTNVSEVRLFDGTTQVASQTTSGPSVDVTLSWPTNATQGSRIIHAEATVDGGTILSSTSITVIVNQCDAGNPDPAFCHDLCEIGLEYMCVAGGHNSGQPCGDPNLGYSYRGFDCSGNSGCCSEGGYTPGNTNTPIIFSVPSFVNPTSGETITTGDYTVNTQVQSSDPTYLAMDFYIDADLRGTQNWYSSNPNTNIYVYSQPMDLRGLSGSHTFRAVIYDRNNPGVTQEASVTVNINILTPTAEILSPGEGETVSGVVPVLIQGTFASGNVDKLELYDALNYGLIASLNVPTPDPNVLEVIDWDTAGYSNGNYSLYAIAYSGTDYGLSGFVNVVVNNVPVPPPTPVVTILAPKDGDKVSGVITVEINATFSGGNIESIELNEPKLGLIGSVKPATPGPDVTEKIDWDTMKAVNGDYYLQAVAISGADSGKSVLVHVGVSN
jgi:hypothetical protein